MRKASIRQQFSGEEGISLIEVIVAFVIFGLIAAALIPALIISIQNTTRNAAIATAAQLANERIEEVRAASPSLTCAALFTTVTSQHRYFTDDRGTRFRVSSVLLDPTADSAAGVLNATCNTDFVQVSVVVDTVNASGTVYDHPHLPSPVVTAVTETYLPRQFAGVATP